MTNRRTLLMQGAVTLAGAPMLPLVASTQAAAMSQTPDQPLFDFSKPKDNLDGLVKVMADLSGKAVWISAQGRIYSMQPETMSRPIFAVEGLRWAQFTKIEDGYRMQTRDWALYKDVNTGEVLDVYNNPFTGARNETRHILTRVMGWDMTENGQRMPSFTGDAWLMNRPLQLNWTQDGDDVAVPLELLVKYPSGPRGGEWMNFITSAKELHDPARTSASMRHSWTGDSGWINWMEMGDIPGRTLWQSTGRKHSRLESIRPEMRKAVDRYFPGSLEAPETYEKSSYTTSPDEA